MALFQCYLVCCLVVSDSVLVISNPFVICWDVVGLQSRVGWGHVHVDNCGDVKSTAGSQSESVSWMEL